MEKAKLILTSAKKKKIDVRLQFKDGKTMSLPHHNLQDMALNGSEVEVERQGGRIVLVKSQGNVLYSVQPQQQPPQLKLASKREASPKPVLQEKRPQLDQQVSILVGIYGSGKTTVLELIKHALAGEYENPDKVKYPPQEFAIFFNNGEQLKYQQRELAVKPSFRLLPEFISTFDVVLDKDDRDGASKASVQIGRQLTEKFLERINRFYFELKLLPAGIDPKPCLEEFIEIVKEVFHQTTKEIELAGEFVIRQSDGQILMPDQLSAGEKQILIILLTALILKLRSLSNADQHYLLIMDEPENSLHLRWQKLLIGYVRRLNENTQIIIATHAPAIIKKGWLKNTTELNQIKSSMGA